MKKILFSPLSLIVLLLVVWAVSPYILPLVFTELRSAQPEKINSVFSAVTALFTGLGFAIMAYSMIHQRKAFESQIESFEEERILLKKQIRISSIQSQISIIGMQLQHSDKLEVKMTRYQLQNRLDNLIRELQNITD
jgi:hypothetical protein